MQNFRSPDFRSPEVGRYALTVRKACLEKLVKNKDLIIL